MTEVVVARGVLFHLHRGPVSRIEQDDIRTEEVAFDHGLGHENKVERGRVLRKLIELRDAVVREVACGKNAAEVLARAVAGDELIFDDKIDAVHKTLIDVGDKSRSIGHQLLGHASKVSDRLDRASLGLEGGRAKRLLSTFSNEGRSSHVFGFLFLHVLEGVRGDRKRREEAFNRQRTESAREDARTTVSLNDAACRREDRVDGFLLVERFSEFDTSLLGRAVAEGLEAVCIDDVVAGRLNFSFLLGSHTPLLKIKQHTGELNLFLTEALEFSGVGLRSLRHLALDRLESLHDFIHFHGFHLSLGERLLKLLQALEQFLCRFFFSVRLPLTFEKLLGFCDDGRRHGLRETACIPQEIFKVTNGFQVVNVLGADFRHSRIFVSGKVNNRDFVQLRHVLDDAAAVLLAFVIAFSEAEANREAVNRAVLHRRHHSFSLSVAWRKFTLHKQALFILYGREPLADRNIPIVTPEHLRHAVLSNRLLVCSGEDRVVIGIIAVKSRRITLEASTTFVKFEFHARERDTLEI
nr:MAG TPA: hypothetical protein [Caudoviricetes sp.]